MAPSNLRLLILVTAALLAPPALAQTIVNSGNLVGSQTWTAAGSPYLLSGDLTVPAGATLTIEAGTEVQLGAGDDLASGIDTGRAELRVAGTLAVDGTAASRVMIRSAAPSPSAGLFYGVVLLPGATTTISNTTIESGHRCLHDQSAGASLSGVITDTCGYGIQVEGGSPTISNAEIRNATSYGLYLHGGAGVTATGILVANNGSYGVYATDSALALSESEIRSNGSRGVYFRSTAGTHTMSLAKSTVYGNGTYGVEVYEAGGILSATVRDNLILSNGSYGVRTSGSPNMTVSHNLVFGHTSDYSGVSGGTGSVVEDPLLVDPANGDFRPTSRSGARFAASDGTDVGAFPYDGVATPALTGHLYVNTVLSAAASPHTVTGDLTVEPGVTLTVEPGAEVRFAALSDQMSAGEDEGRAELLVQGTLVADGTASLGITFTSAAATRARGDWYGIHLLDGSASSVLDYTTVQYARYGVRSGAPSGTVIQRTTIEESASYGIYATGGGAAFSELVVRNNGSYGVYFTDASPTLERSRIHDNSSRGVYVRSTAGTHNVAILRNTIAGNGTYGVEVYEAGGILGATIQNNLITDNGSYGIRASGSPNLTVGHNLVWGQTTDYSSVSGGTGSVVENPLLVDLANRDLRITSHSPARLHASDGSDIGALPYDGAPTPGVQGHLYADTTWNASGGPIDVLGDVTVEPGVTLTIEAGTTVRFAATDSMGGNTQVNRAELLVLGRLIADGAAQSPVTLTSAAGTPSRGDWYGVLLTGTAASSSVEHTVIEYALYGVRSEAPATTSITQSEIRESSSYGVYVPAGAALLDGLFVHDNGSYGVYVTDASPSLYNLVLASNTSRGLYVRSTAGTHTVAVNHATIYGNGSYGIETYEAGGILSVSIRNSIVAENGSYGIRASGSPNLTLANNNVWGHTTDYSSVSAGPGSISANPQFVDTGLMNFYLLPSSTSIDGADPTTALTHDISGAMRPLDGDNNASALPDLGAYEFNPSANRWPIADAGPARIVTSAVSATFDASGSYDPDGTIATYLWDFGDATQGSGATVSHTFSGGTDRTVTLTVTDNSGAIDVDTIAVEVNLPPVADAGPARFADPAEVITFSGAGSTDPDGSVVSWQWDFGDGNQASGSPVTHQYASGGAYTVTLTVTDDDGAADTDTTTVNVTGNDGAPPSIAHTPITGGQPANQPVTISADVTDSSGVASVTLYYRTSGTGSFSSTPMALVTGSTYQANIPPSAVAPPGVDYYVEAVDSAPATNVGTHPPGAPGALHSFAVSVAPPAITHTPITDGQPAGQAVTVFATVTSPVGIASVTLFHRPPGGGTFTAVPMTSAGGDDYSAQIPAGSVVAPSVEYYVEAVDTAQPASTVTAPSSGVYVFSVTASDTSPPAIIHTPIADGQIEGAPVSVLATITDASGVATATLYYRVSGGAFTSVAMTSAGGDAYEGTIPMSAVSQPGVDYYLEASDAASPANTGTDPSGAPAGFHSFTVTRSFDLSEGDVVVSEIMADPSGDETTGEWFELYNTTANDLDIDGVTFSDEGTDSFTVENGGPLPIPAGGYLVLGRSDDTTVNGGVAVDYVYSGFALSNRDDEIVIRAGTLEVDRVRYDDGATFPDQPGRSLTLDPTTLDFASNDDGGNWCIGATMLPGGDFGTPGAPNDACQGQIDETPPAIVHTPILDGQQAGLAVPVAAVITDASGVGAASLFYRVTGSGAFAELPMIAIGNGAYQAEIPAPDVTTAGVEYYLRSEDAAPSPNEALDPVSGEHGFTVTVEDTAGPSITHLPIAGEKEAGVAITIEALITDGSGILSATLHYRADGGAFVDLPMSDLGGGGFTAEIPALEAVPGIFEYYLSALDASPAENGSALPASGAQAPFTFTVVGIDEEPPIITHAPVADGRPQGSAVPINLTAVDPSGIAEVRLYYRQTGTGSFESAVLSSANGDEYAGEIPASAVTARGVEYYLEAADASDDQNIARDPADAPASVHAFTVEPASKDEAPPEIVHTPIGDDRPAGVPINVIAEIVDPSGVGSASLFYRTQGATAFVELELVQQSGTDRFEGIIPNEAIVEPGLEYYVSAADASAAMNRSFFPANAPQDLIRFGVTAEGDGTSPPEEGGCGCAATDEHESGWTGLLLLGLVLLMRRRRI